MGCTSRVQTIRCWLCVHDQLSTRSVRLSQQEIRKLAPTCAHVCDICSEQRGHVLFCFKKEKDHSVPRLTAHALHGDMEGLRRASGSRVTLHVVAFFFQGGATVYGTATSLRLHGCQSSLSSTEDWWSQRTSVKVSFRSQLPETPTT